MSQRVDISADIQHSAAVLYSGRGRQLSADFLAELCISCIWELGVLQHPSKLGFVSTIPQRQGMRVG